MIYVINTDGGARGNPGPAGAGVVIRDESGATVAELSKYLGHSTNNAAEYDALILALQHLQQSLSPSEYANAVLHIHMDSELIVRQMQGVYKVKHPQLIEKKKRVDALLQRVKSATFTHVLRAKNADADRLANSAMDKGA